MGIEFRGSNNKGLKKSWLRDVFATKAFLRRPGINSSLEGEKGGSKNTEDWRVTVINSKFKFGK